MISNYRTLRVLHVSLFLYFLHRAFLISKEKPDCWFRGTRCVLVLNSYFINVSKYTYTLDSVHTVCKWFQYSFCSNKVFYNEILILVRKTDLISDETWRICNYITYMYTVFERENTFQVSVFAKILSFRSNGVRLNLTTLIFHLLCRHSSTNYLSYLFVLCFEFSKSIFNVSLQYFPYIKSWRFRLMYSNFLVRLIHYIFFFTQSGSRRLLGHTERGDETRL